MASTSVVMEVSSVPMEDISIADKAWDLAFILEKLRDTECSLLRETRFFDSSTLLHVAASFGHDQIVEAILSKQQCQELLMAKNSSGDLPLHVAVNAGHLPIVQQLLKSSEQCQELLTAENSSGDLPLHVAVNAGHMPIVRQLLKSSHQCEELLTAKNSSGDLPLHVAVNAMHLPIIKQLVKSNVDVVCKLLKEENKEGRTPLGLALSKKGTVYGYKYREVVEFLTETGRKAEDGELMEFESGSGKSPPGYKAYMVLLFGSKGKSIFRKVLLGKTFSILNKLFSKLVYYCVP